ncbi:MULTISPECIES: acyl-homoserine-lactone synthase SolI [Ralstonia solanacearum species complex]|uniref:acyl-homoserine-lactone synthase SolI n=1 Tax=Ralstonia solanacearum species complex TaxID=3116862 RepID=UPI000E56BF65|nr:acyl-homoserine-lactone synthase SolI [Ralstonia solanacearum]BEU70597.1 N-acylhomoserine lactone synthase BspI1 [Ralstonia pseudosolanacearum]AXV75640.1 acyl-homoserine-lactone synthase [Ralstonia solanacearum]AXV89640.1 acyl-homoserine-lactone synthase [Ralstonia solanacearum]AXW17846.1 acyl-homoserine-lactone synthase [Ralstonia solanacearum]AXW74553.1 acyl-homoserine-lactone synthase [Ralstonia solanacearum]
MRTFVHGGGRLPEGVDAALAHYRHQIFVGQLGWQLPMADGMFERDQYDRDDTVYVVARDENGTICGCARLLPTTRPYPLKDVFAPLLMKGMPAPESPGVWELSRFAARSGAPRARGGCPGWAVRPMLASVVQCAAQRGARQLIGVTFASMVRLFRRIGVRAHHAGPVRCVGGRPVVACWIDLDASTCAALGIPGASVAPGSVLQ